MPSRLKNPRAPGLRRAMSVVALSFWTLAVACAGGRNLEAPRVIAPSFHELPSGTRVRQVFTQRLDGLVSDLDLAGDGSSLLVSTLPDRERPGGARDNRLRKLDRTGKTLWSRKLDSSARAQAISHDGSLSFVSTYDDRLIAIDGRGKTAWEAHVTCRPQTIETPGRAPRVLCFHDDDASPETAFDVFDWKGKRVASLPSEGDTLSLRLSHDLTRAAVISGGGLLTVADAWSAQPLWKKRFQGELIDVALADGPQGAVAILVDAPKGGRTIQWLDSQGKLLAQAPAGAFARQIVFVTGSSGGVMLAAYGTSAHGQSLAGWTRQGDKLARAWEHSDQRGANYPASLESAGGRIFTTLDDSEDPSGGTARHSHWLSFSSDGKMRSNYVLHSQPGSYLYATSVVREGKLTAIAADDGTIALLEMSDADIQK